MIELIINKIYTSNDNKHIQTHTEYKLLEIEVYSCRGLPVVYSCAVKHL